MSKTQKTIAAIKADGEMSDTLKEYFIRMEKLESTNWVGPALLGIMFTCHAIVGGILLYCMA